LFVDVFKPVTKREKRIVNAIATRPLTLVTGASGGIGADLAELAARDGHDLIVVARRVEALEARARALAALHGVAVHAYACDLSDPGAVDALCARLATDGRRITNLVNNAGYGLFGEFAVSDLADEQRMMRLNMEAPVILAKRLLPGIIAGRGCVLNVASTAGFQPGPYMAVYYASKAFVLNWSDALAEELRNTGVRVTALCPGPTRTGFQDRAAMHASGLLRWVPGTSSAEVARAGWDGARRGRRVVIPGLFNRVMAQSVRGMPRRMVTTIVRAMSAPRAGAGL